MRLPRTRVSKTKIEVSAAALSVVIMNRKFPDLPLADVRQLM
jgi:hypothetical protein